MALFLPPKRALAVRGRTGNPLRRAARPGRRRLPALGAVAGRLLRWRGLRSRVCTYLIRRVLGCPVVLADGNGFRFIVEPQEPLDTLFRNGYLGYPEIGEQRFCRSVVREGMVAFDVGANIGQFTVLLATLVGRSGRVCAFEPCESTLRRLRANVVLNGLDNVVAERLIVHAQDGASHRLNVFPPGYSVWNTLGEPTMYARGRPQQRVRPIGQEIVPAVTLDAYCARHGISTIDYLKVDVEGAELEALQGCRRLLERGAVRHLQFEISQAMLRGLGRDGSEVFELLAGHGYRCHPISAGGELLPPVSGTKAFFANFIAVPGAEETGVAEDQRDRHVV